MDATGRATLDEALNATGWQRMVAQPITNTFKRHVFPHFCAGETLDDCRGVAEKLAAINVRVVVDHSKYVRCGLGKQRGGRWAVSMYLEGIGGRGGRWLFQCEGVDGESTGWLTGVCKFDINVVEVVTS